ncbi:hypothetical protein ACWIG5_37605 [Streptomyces lydicus]
MGDSSTRKQRIRHLLEETNQAGAELLRLLDLPSKAQPGESWEAFNEQEALLREVVTKLRGELSYGFIYGLYDWSTLAIRYVGQTVSPLRIRLDQHTRSHSLVGDRIGGGRSLAIEALGHPHAHDRGPWLPSVAASQLTQLERYEIYRYTWAGAALLNKSNSRDDARAWQWYLESAYDGRWSSIHQWREEVRNMPCYECPAHGNESCAELQHGANHLGRIAAHVRRQWCHDRRKDIIEVAISVLGDPYYAQVLEDDEVWFHDWNGTEHIETGALQWAVSSGAPVEARVQIAMRQLVRLEQQHLRMLRRDKLPMWLRPPEGELERLLNDMSVVYAEIGGIKLGATERPGL